MKDRALTIGTLVSIKRTGVLIDQQPQLALTYDVDAPGGRQFRGVAREIVGLDEFHVMTPGLVLPVSYDSTKSDDNLKVAQDGDRNVVNAIDAPPATDSVGASQPDAGADRGAGDFS